MKIIIWLCLLGCMACANGGLVPDVIKDKLPLGPLGRADSANPLDAFTHPTDLFGGLWEKLKEVL